MDGQERTATTPRPVPRPPPPIPQTQPEQRARGPAAQMPARGKSQAPAPRPIEFRLKAPLYDNSLSTGFFGDVTLRIEGGRVTISGKRSIGGKGGQFMGAGLVIGFFAVSSLATGLLALTGMRISSTSSTIASTATGVVLGALGLLTYLYGESAATKDGGDETVEFDLEKARNRKTHFNWNIGRGLALLVTPFVSLPIMLALGKRVVRLRVPVGPDGRLGTLSLRACSRAEGAAVDRALRVPSGTVAGAQPQPG